MMYGMVGYDIFLPPPPPVFFFFFWISVFEE
jgi:hypothetical protein